METQKTNKILWLDDDFKSVLQDQSFISQDEYAKASPEDKYFNYLQKGLQENYPQIELIPITNVDDFKSHFDDSVVLSILDVKGCNHVDEMQRPDTDAYYQVEAFLVRDLSRKVIVFSGNIDKGDTAFDLTKSFGAKGWAAVSKKEDACYQVLLQKVLHELVDYQFVHHSYIPGLCREGVFNETDLSILSEILQSYQNQEFSHTYLNAMRTTLASLMDHFIQIFDADAMKQLEERLTYKDKYINLTKGANRFNNIKDLVSQRVKYHDKKPDYDAPYVPYNVCPLEVKHAFNFLWEFVNIASHQREVTPEYHQLFPEHTHQPHLVMTYEAFFLVLEWFYHFFTDKKGQMETADSFKTT